MFRASPFLRTQAKRPTRSDSKYQLREGGTRRAVPDVEGHVSILSVVQPCAAPTHSIPVPVHVTGARGRGKMS
jgi:hypothetical protein